jgi:hypothetical protein
VNPVLYAILCVLVPAAWGLVMYHAFGFVDRRRRVREGARPAAEPEYPPIDYYI